MGFLDNLFNMADKREIKAFSKVADKIDAMEPKFEAMTNKELRNMTNIFKERLAKGETLDDILPEAFATVREASKRVLGLRHYNVQLIGGMVLHQGRIAEMKTGEGKTLVATAPVYLNALEGKGVHVVTVNDYLAKRDKEEMGKVYEFLGLTVGVIVHGQNPEVRRKQYECDITYGTNNEYGFDYLKDNMVIHKEQRVQRELNYAIVDEVDSILIDEARTPLIISGPGDKSTHLYTDANTFVLTLKRPSKTQQEKTEEEKELPSDGDYEIDEKQKAVSLSESGIKKAELYFNVENITDVEHTELFHHINQALKAHAIMKKDVDYVAKDGEIVIVDEFTGRLMFGRRYSEGLHQAIEAKEGLHVQRESKTLATITFQNFFRMYSKLAGMTGTAKTEEQEFQKIYGLDVVVIPTNKPMVRIDYPDVILKTKRAKYKAAVNEIEECHKSGRPVLVGTTSIAQSEELSAMLKRRGIPHNVLNAKYHEKEAEIISGAGQYGAVTIATNMAGRGTDIVLGEGVPELGGLHIIGTERHESRRIDNQLRGRCARQGDPGSSKFFLSLEDDLMRLFGSDNISSIMDKLGMEEDEPIEHKLVTRSIESAQKKVEARNFAIRKQVLEYDDVMNQQREVIYAQRKKILQQANLRDTIMDMIHKVVDRTMAMYAPPEVYSEDWDLQALIAYAEEFYAPADLLQIDYLQNLSREELEEYLHKVADEHYAEREDAITPELMRELENLVMLKVVDNHWMEHLDSMDLLREGVGLRAYGQKDPLVEYKFEAYDMFQAMIDAIQDDVVRYIYRVNVVAQPKVENRLENASTNNPGEGDDIKKQPLVKGETTGRNDLCPCGSGKKYKNCCGQDK